MSMNDPVADMLTRIRNALAAGKSEVKMPGSKLKLAIAAVLKDEGYIVDYSQSTADVQNSLTVELKYFNGVPVIDNIQRVSTPGRRMYKSVTDLPQVDGGLGVSVISTSRGVMSDKSARASGIGGEVLCVVS